MNIEQKLLVSLIANTPNSKLESLLSRDINWESLIETARNQRIIPILYRKLQPYLATLPKETLDSVQILAKKCSVRNLTFNSELFKITNLFEENEIEYLSYKGLTLAQLAYGDSSLRQFGDLDFLIQKRDFPKVKKLLLSNGGKPALDLSDKQEKAILKYSYDFPFGFGKQPVLVEIHWAFMESFFGFDYEIEETFSRRQMVNIHGKNIPTLSNEDLLIYLCVHGSKHFWKRLSWTYDIGKLVQNQTIKWEFVIDQANKHGTFRMLKLGLLLAQNYINFELPSELQSQIEADKKIRLIADELNDQLFDDEYSAESIRTDIHLKMRERWRDKLTYSHRLLTTKLVDSLFMPMGKPR